MALKVIVGVSVDQHHELPDLVAKIALAAQFGGAINNSLIPGHCLCFDLFPVAKPADVRPVPRNRIELEFLRAWHPRSILQHKRNLMLSQEARELGVEPVAIADFNPKLVVSWQLPQERNQSVGECMPI